MYKINFAPDGQVSFVQNTLVDLLLCHSCLFLQEHCRADQLLDPPYFQRSTQTVSRLDSFASLVHSPCTRLQGFPVQGTCTGVSSSLLLC